MPCSTPCPRDYVTVIMKTPSRTQTARVSNVKTPKIPKRFHAPTSSKSRTASAPTHTTHLAQLISPAPSPLVF